jgi:hypothetical protein
LPAVPEGNFRIAVADFGWLSGYPEPLAAGCSKHNVNRSSISTLQLS